MSTAPSKLDFPTDCDMRILTDIEILQSSQWCEQTEFFVGRKGTDSLLKYFPSSLAVTVAALRNAIYILYRYRRFDVIINADIKTAQFVGLFRTFFRLKTPRHIILELMLDETGSGFSWRLKKRLQKLCFFSVNVIFVSSSREVESYTERFSLQKGQVRFLPFHTNITEPRNVDGAGGYILSAGRTGRDFATLAAAVEGLNTKVVVVGDENSLKDVHFPENVEVHKGISYPQYLELLYGCEFTVIPLLRLVKSTGQVAFLESMALGKPVVATETTGSLDYIENGRDGILVPPGDPIALRDVIERMLQAPQLCDELSANALQKVEKHFTFAAYTSQILAAAEEIIGQKR